MFCLTFVNVFYAMLMSKINLPFSKKAVVLN